MPVKDSQEGENGNGKGSEVTPSVETPAPITRVEEAEKPAYKLAEPDQVPSGAPAAADRDKEAAKTASGLAAPEKPKELSEDEKKFPMLIGVPEGQARTDLKGLLEQREGLIKENKPTGFLDLIIAYQLLMAKYKRYLDLLPGAYLCRLTGDEKNPVKKETFDKDQLAKVLDAKKPDYSEDTNTDKYASFGIEKASTMYVAQTLWGISDIESPDALALRLIHTTKTVKDEDGYDEEAPYFRSLSNYGNENNLDSLKKKGMPYGTVLIFVPNLETAEKIVAFATGNNDEVQYFDPKKNRVQTFKLSDKGVPTNGLFSFQCAFIPKFNSDPEYFKEKEKDLDARLEDNKPVEAIPVAPNDPDNKQFDDPVDKTPASKLRGLY